MSVLTVDGNLKPLGYQQITTANLAAAKELTVPAGAVVALVQVTGQNVRWRDDGTDPTAAIGMQLAAGKDFFYTGDLSTIRFIREASGAILNVSYYNG